MIKLKEEIEKGKKAEFQFRDDDMIVKGQIMCVPEYGELKRDIMEEAHSSAYVMHPGSTKMYRTLNITGGMGLRKGSQVRLQMPNLSTGEGRA